MKIGAILFCLSLAAIAVQPAAADPVDIGSLVDSSDALFCPDHPGTRAYRSEIAQYGTDKAYLITTAHRAKSACDFTTSVHIIRAGHETSFTLSSGEEKYWEIADFSPDHSHLLLFDQTMIGELALATGEMHLQNPRDFMEWKNCKAGLSPQTYMGDDIAINMIPFETDRWDCLRSARVYRVNLKKRTAQWMDNPPKLQHLGKDVAAPYETCASDPDVAGECFTVHGRLGIYNGNPQTRIWRIGTNRVLGVENEVVPESVWDHVDYGTDAYGDYRVCPLTEPKPETMQMVCIESVQKLIFKKE